MRHKIKLNFREKCYLVALFGDVSQAARERLFSYSSFPPQAGPLVMQEGYRFLEELRNARARKPFHPALS